MINAERLKQNEGREAETKKYTCGFKHLGIGVLVVFMTAVVVGFFITVYNTRFTPEHDFVMAYFHAKNPCIVFDHYPAKLWAMMFMSIFGVLSTAWAGMLWLWLFGKRHLQSLLFGTLVIAVHVWYCIQFINIFAYQMYDESAPDELYGVVNGTITPAQMEIVAGHTTPYMNLQLVDAILMFYGVTLIYQFEVKSRSKNIRMALLTFLAVCTLATYVMIMGWIHWETIDITGYSAHSVVMTAALLTNYFGSQIFSVIAQVVYRVFLPPSWKVTFTFTAKPSANTGGVINADNVVQLGFRFLACICILVFMFANPREKEDQNTSDFTNSAFLSPPGVLIFAPAMGMASLVFGVGLWLNYVRMDMWNEKLDWPNWRHYLSGALAGAFVFNVVLVGWRVIPDAKWTHYLDFPLFFLFSAWSVVSNTRNPLSLVYNGFLVFLFLLGFLHWGFRIIALGLLCFYERGVGEFPPMYVQVDALGGIDMHDFDIFTTEDAERVNREQNDFINQVEKGATKAAQVAEEGLHRVEERLGLRKRTPEEEKKSAAVALQIRQ